MRPSQAEQIYATTAIQGSGNFLAVPGKRSALKSAPRNKKNLKHMNSIGSTTRTKLNEYKNNSRTPNNKNRNKRFQFRKTRTYKDKTANKKFKH
jgi:hypothetical protein